MPVRWVGRAILSAVVALVLLVLFPVERWWPGDPEPLAVFNILSGPEHQTYHSMAVDLCIRYHRSLSAQEEDDAPRCLAVSTEGSEDNLEALGRNEGLFGFVQSDVFSKARADGMVGSGGLASAVIVGSLYSEAVFVRTRAEESRLESLVDLLKPAGPGGQDKWQVASGSAGSGTKFTAERLLAMLPEMAKTVRTREYRQSDMEDGLCAGRIDVAFTVIDAARLLPARPAANCSLKLLAVESMTDDAFKPLSVSLDGRGEPSVQTVAVDALLVTRDPEHPLFTKIKEIVAEM